MTDKEKLIALLEQHDLKDFIFAGVIETEGHEKYMVASHVDSPLRSLGLAKQLCRVVESSFDAKEARDVLE